MKPHELTQEYLINGWLLKNHDITVKELIEKEPELVKSPEWFRKYAVTQEQHDEWYKWAISIVMKTYKMNKKMAQRNFAFPYLNTSPSIINDKNIKQ